MGSDQREAAAPAVGQLVSRDGATAAVVREEQGDVITVRDKRGRLLFELREGVGVVSIVVAEGDLELRADQGKVRIVGAEGIELESRAISLRAERLVQSVQVLETHAGRILERAKDVYRDVESLSQLRAGQVRIVAKHSFRALAERLRFKARKDVKLDGEQIYLG